MPQAFSSDQLTQDQTNLLCQYGTYQAEVPNPGYDPDTEGSQQTITNPITPTQFADQMVVTAVNNYLQEQFNRNLIAGSGSGSAPLISS